MAGKTAPTETCGRRHLTWVQPVRLSLPLQVHGRMLDRAKPGLRSSAPRTGCALDAAAGLGRARTSPGPAASDAGCRARNEEERDG